MTQRKDTTLRAMTDDGSFRAITADTTQTVRGALASQPAARSNAGLFADLLSGAIMIRETMAPTLRVQTILKQTTPRMSIVSDSHPSGDTRGLVVGATERISLENALLQVMRTMPNGAIHQGVVKVPEGGTVSEALMNYMETSEQVSTMMAVNSTFDDDGNLLSAGGYLVQLLPEVGKAPLAVMAERLDEFRSIEALLTKADFSPRWLMSELLYGMPFTELGESGIRFGCWCSRTSVLGALATLDRSEIQDMVSEGKVLEIQCDYCQSEYAIPPAELTGLLQRQ